MGDYTIYKWVIYRITSPTGKVYIGKTKDFDTRVKLYKYPNTKQPLIGNSISKYGFDAHVIDIIDELYGTCEQCDSKEMFWIRTYMSNRSKWPKMNGLNLTDGGDGATGLIRSEDSKRKMSEKMKELYLTFTHPMKGVKKPFKPRKTPHSAETIEKIRKANIGRIITDEHRRKMSLAKIGGISNRSRPIIASDIIDGVVGQYASITEASKILKVSKSDIHRVLNSEYQSYKGFEFKYAV